MLKKALLLSILLLIVSANAFSEDPLIIYYDDVSLYNQILSSEIKVTLAIIYIEEDNKYFFAIQGTQPTFFFAFDPEYLDVIRNILTKFLEWEKLAVEKQVEIAKEIPDSTILSIIIWTIGDTSHMSTNFSPVFTFRSTNPNTHKLVISGPKVTAHDNKYLTFKMDDIILNKTQVESFLAGISQESIQKAKDESTKKKEAESLFN